MVWESALIWNVPLTPNIFEEFPPMLRNIILFSGIRAKIGLCPMSL